MESWFRVTLAFTKAEFEPENNNDVGFYNGRGNIPHHRKRYRYARLITGHQSIITNGVARLAYLSTVSLR